MAIQAVQRYDRSATTGESGGVPGQTEFVHTIVYEMTKFGDTIWVKANYVLCCLSFILPIMLILIIAVSCFQRDMGKQGLWRWAAIILIIISPLLFFLFNSVELAIPVVLLQGGLFFAIAKFKRPNRILTL